MRDVYSFAGGAMSETPEQRIERLAMEKETLIIALEKIRNALADIGRARWSVQYVRDVVDAALKAVERKP